MSRETTFQKKINQRWALLLREIDQDETLSDLLFHLRFLLASNAAANDGFSTHPICKNPDNQVIFAAFTKPLLAKIGPCPPWEEEPFVLEKVLLQILDRQIKKRIPQLHAVFEDNLPNILRFFAFSTLEETVPNERDRKGWRKRVRENITIAFDRLPDNPIRLTRDPATGAIAGEDLHLASTKQLLEIKSLQRIFESKEKPGRRKGSKKPIGSGRRTIDPQLCMEAWKSKQDTKKNQSPAWWLVFARKKNLTIPEDGKGQTALRKKLEEWAIKGRTLSR
jgi:hypothetical protein